MGKCQEKGEESNEIHPLIFGEEGKGDSYKASQERPISKHTREQRCG